MRAAIIFIFLSLVVFSSCGRRSSSALSRPDHSMSSQRSQVVQLAKSKLGSGYKMGATGPRKFDCSGFTQYVYAAAGIDLPRTSAEQARWGKELSVSKIREGDLVVFKKGRKVQHVGICVKVDRGQIWVVHSTSSRGVIMENVSASSYWRGRLRSGRAVVR